METTEKGMPQMPEIQRYTQAGTALIPYYGGNLVKSVDHDRIVAALHAYHAQELAKVRKRALEEAAKCCSVEAAKYSKSGHEAAACRGALAYVEAAIRALSELPNGKE